MPLTRAGEAAKLPIKDRIPITMKSTIKWSAGKPLVKPGRIKAAMVIGGKIWVIGEADFMAVYYPALNSWSTRAYPFSFECDNYVATPAGKIYAIGGFSDSGRGKKVEEFDPVTNLVKPMSDLPVGAIITSAIATPDGKIYVIGGFNYPPVTTITLNAVQEFNPVTNVWTLKTPMPTARYNMPLALTNTGAIYAFGGYVSLPSTAMEVSVVERYDPTNDTWTTTPDMPLPNSCHSAVRVRDRFFSIGGLRNCEGTSTVEEYIPAQKRWNTKTPLQTGRWYMGAVAIDNKIYVIGGLRRDHYTGPNIPDPENLTSVEIGTVTFKIL